MLLVAAIISPVIGEMMDDGFNKKEIVGVFETVKV